MLAALAIFKRTYVLCPNSDHTCQRLQDSLATTATKGTDMTQQQGFLVLESMHDCELEQRIEEWDALSRCSNYDDGSALRIAVLVAYEHATVEQARRGAVRGVRRLQGNASS